MNSLKKQQMSQVKYIICNEWRKVRGGSGIFLVLLLLTGGYARLMPVFHQVAAATAVLLTMYTVFLARAFAAEQRHDQLPFQLGLPVSPRKIFLVKYLFGSVLLLLGGMTGLLMASRWLPAAWFHMPLLWLALYSFLLMNSQWSEHGIAEVVLQIAVFGGILAVNCFAELFYCIGIGHMMRTCALLQLILILAGIAGMVWIGGIYRSRRRPWLPAAGYLVLILLPPLQFGAGIGINRLKLAHLEKRMAAKGIELVDFPAGGACAWDLNISVDSLKNAELWLKHPDMISAHRRFSRLLELTGHNRGRTVDPLMPRDSGIYMDKTLKAHYLTGNEAEFLKTFNYMRSIDRSYRLAADTCRGIFALPGSPLDNAEFYRRWHEAAARKLTPQVLYNRGADDLRNTLQRSGGSLYSGLRDWSLRGRDIGCCLKHDEPFSRFSDPVADIIALKLYHLEHGDLPESREGPFEYRRRDRDTFTLKTDRIIRIKLKETGK